MLRLDTTQAARTVDELTALVEAVFNAPSEAQETNWLEWKSSLDLSTPEGRGTVAKAILGFANRSVEQALLACEGVAYMLIGVQPGAAPGIPADDHATLGQRLETYVPRQARWTAHYVEFSRVTVLVIVVEPPKSGQRILTLQKEYSKSAGKKITTYRAGTIFHRGEAQTEPAEPKVVEMLEERLLQGVRTPDLKVSLSVDAQPLERLEITEESVVAWLSVREQSVRDNSGKKPEKPKPTTYEGLGIGAVVLGNSAIESLSGIGDMMGRWANPKDREKFEDSVTNYLAKCRRGLVDIVVRKLVKSDENKVTITVHNDTDDPIAGVSVRTRFPKAGVIVYDSAPSAPPEPPIPKWPDPLDDVRPFALSRQPIAAPAVPFEFESGRSSVKDAGDHFEVQWKIGDLLARDFKKLVVTIVAGMGAPDVIEVDLEARSKRQRGVARASASLQVSSDKPWQLQHWWNPILRSSA